MSLSRADLVDRLGRLVGVLQTKSNETESHFHKSKILIDHRDERKPSTEKQSKPKFPRKMHLKDKTKQTTFTVEPIKSSEHDRILESKIQDTTDFIDQVVEDKLESMRKETPVKKAPESPKHVDTPRPKPSKRTAHANNQRILARKADKQIRSLKAKDAKNAKKSKRDQQILEVVTRLLRPDKLVKEPSQNVHRHKLTKSEQQAFIDRNTAHQKQSNTPKRDAKPAITKREQNEICDRLAKCPEKKPKKAESPRKKMCAVHIKESAERLSSPPAPRKTFPSPTRQVSPVKAVTPEVKEEIYRKIKTHLENSNAQLNLRYEIDDELRISLDDLGLDELEVAETPEETETVIVEGVVEEEEEEEELTELSADAI